MPTIRNTRRASGSAHCSSSPPRSFPFAAITLGADRDRSWWIQARLLLRVAVAAAYGVALFVGIAIAIFAIEQLFELDIDDDVYAHLAGWTFFALVPWIVVGGRVALVGPASPRAEGARRVARLAATFFAAPLAVGYTAILYAYAVRVAVTGEVPKNLLSPLVIGAGALWLLLAFLVEPIRADAVEDSAGQGRDEGESTAAKTSAEAPGSTALTLLARWLPPALLPMLALGIWAVAVRIQQYGWTEFRYVRLAVLAALVVLRGRGDCTLLMRSRGRVAHGNRAPLSWSAVPAVLALAMFLSAVGPWSAPAVALRSQKARLAAAIAQARQEGGPPGGPIGEDSAGAALAVAPDTSASNTASPGTAPRRRIPAELHTTINETAVFLARHFGPEGARGSRGLRSGRRLRRLVRGRRLSRLCAGARANDARDCTPRLRFAAGHAGRARFGGRFPLLDLGGNERNARPILPIVRRSGCPSVVVSNGFRRGRVARSERG